MCNHVEESGQMPSLESLRSVDAIDSPIEVVLIDKQKDSRCSEIDAHKKPKEQLLRCPRSTQILDVIIVG